MDKRILGSIITILILLGVLWAFALSSANTIDNSFITLANSTIGSRNFTTDMDSLDTMVGGNISLNFTVVPNFSNLRDTFNITNLTLYQNSPIYFEIRKILNTTGLSSYLGCKVIQSGHGIQCINQSITGPSNVSGNGTLRITVEAALNWTPGTYDIENPTASQWNAYVYTNNSKGVATAITTAASSAGIIDTISIGIDDLAPRISSINISDGTYTRTGKDSHLNDSLAGYLLNASDLTVTVVLREYNKQEVYMYWGAWNGTLKTIAGAHGGTNWSIAFSSTTQEKPINMTRGCVGPLYDDIATCTYTGVIENSMADNFTDGSTYVLMFWTNDSFNHKANLTNGNSGYNFTIDGDIPFSTLTMPKVTNIYNSNGISIKCIGTDVDGHANHGIVTITDPAGRETSKTVDPENFEATFKGVTEIGRAGAYKVKCAVQDQVGHIGYSSEGSFRVLNSGGVAGISGEEEPVAKVDLSSTTTPSGEISGTQGESDTFTIDGTIAHRLTFLEVGADYAKIKIESDPMEFTLKVGESKEVELDGKTVKVTLSTIVDGKANVSITNVEKYEEKLEEERLAREGSVQEERGWGLWITLLVIIVLIVVGYYVLKSRKGKKGAIHFSRQDLGL